MDTDSPLTRAARARIAGLDRRSLQAEAKAAGIRANQKTVDMQRELLLAQKRLRTPAQPSPTGPATPVAPLVALNRSTPADTPRPKFPGARMKQSSQNMQTFINEHDRLLNDHNDLVESHNDLVDDHNALKDGVKSHFSDLTKEAQSADYNTNMKFMSLHRANKRAIEDMGADARNNFQVLKSHDKMLQDMRDKTRRMQQKMRSKQNEADNLNLTVQSLAQMIRENSVQSLRAVTIVSQIEETLNSLSRTVQELRIRVSSLETRTNNY